MVDRRGQRLPSNLERLRVCLVPGERVGFDRAVELLAEHQAVITPERLREACRKYTIFDVDDDGIALAEPALTEPSDSTSNRDARRNVKHATSEAPGNRDDARDWSQLPEPDQAANVLVGIHDEDGWTIQTLTGLPAMPASDDVVFAHPDLVSPEAEAAGCPVADLTLLVLLTRPDLEVQRIADLARALGLDPDADALRLSTEIAAICLHSIDPNDPSWSVVTRLLAQARDPIASALPTPPLPSELEAVLHPASDHLLDGRCDGPADVALDTVQALQALDRTGYPARAGQRDMALALARAFVTDRHLAVEAPTGTGKSFAYLVAAQAVARDPDRPVLVATHTKVLQAQLRRDANRLRELGLLTVPFRQIQGVSNYICAREIAEALDESDLTSSAARSLAVGIRALAAHPQGTWASISDHVQRSDPGYRSMRASLRTDASDCERSTCAWASSCPMMRALDDVQQRPGIISVNHALLGAWVKQEQEAGEKGKWLMRTGRTTLVLDEAHTLEDSFTSTWTERTGRAELDFIALRLRGRRGVARSVREAIKQAARRGVDPELLQPTLDVLRAVGDTVDLIDACSSGVEDAAETYLLEFGDQQQRVGLLPGVVVARSEYRAIVSAAFDLRRTLGVLVALLEQLREALIPLGSASSDEPPSESADAPPDPVRRAQRRLASLLSVVSEHRALIGALERLPGDGIWVHLLGVNEGVHGERAWVYERVPVSIADQFRANVVGRARSLVLTSATLQVAGRWDFISRRLGVHIVTGEPGPEQLEGLVVASPFDHRKQATLVLTSHLPLPLPTSEAEFVAAVARDQLGFLSLTGGRTLGLFAARRRMEAVAESMAPWRPSLKERGVELLVQGALEPSEIARRFRADPGTVVFGLRSYWEGFDVPGESLSYLVIEKPPYPAIGDPLVQARQKKAQDEGDDPFLDYLVPLAAIQLAQGFGRLIRRTDDRGAALVLDRRMQFPTPANHLLLGTLPTVDTHHAVDAADAWTHAIRFVTGEDPDLGQAIISPVDDLTALLHGLRERFLDDPEGALREAARSIFEIDHLRDNQIELMLAVLAGRDALGLMPTGSGKSICFQLPALVRPDPHPTVVVSPLIALIKDQLDDLRSRRGLTEVQGITGRTSVAERTAILQDLHQGRVRVLYVSPERLVRDPTLRAALAETTLGALVVDEAHCVSMWGLDFRPEFRQLVPAIAQHEQAPRFGLTATATRAVTQDLIETLDLESPSLVREPQDRPNLRYSVQEVANEVDRARALLRFVTYSRERAPEQPGIIYVSRRATAEQVAYTLRACGFPARHFHGGMVPEQRASVQDQFMADQVPIIVATKAFGMGVNKADVGWVVHYDLPESLESYVQESGRAARDPALEADCLLIHRAGDLVRRRKQLRDDQADDQLRRSLRLMDVMATAPRRGEDAVFDGDEVARQLGCETDELNVTLAWLERSGNARRHADCSQRMAVTVGLRVPPDSADATLFRRLFWQLLDTKVGQRRLLDITATAEQIGIEPDELERRLSLWTLGGYVSANSSQRLWRVAIVDPHVQGSILRKNIQEWSRWQHERLESMGSYAARPTTCRRVLIAEHFGDDVRPCSDRDATTACDVCDPVPPAWSELAPERIPDPEGGIDPEVVLLQAVSWTAEFDRGSYGEVGLLAAILGKQSLGHGRPLGRGLLRLPQFGALRYLRAGERRLDEARDRLLQRGELVRREVVRGETFYGTLMISDAGRDRIGTRARARVNAAAGTGGVP